MIIFNSIYKNVGTNELWIFRFEVFQWVKIIRSSWYFPLH